MEVTNLLAGVALRTVGGGVDRKAIPGVRTHTCLTNWLNDSIPPAQAAEWAGNSVPVLLAIHARCVSGQLHDLKKRIMARGDLPEVPGAG